METEVMAPNEISLEEVKKSAQASSQNDADTSAVLQLIIFTLGEEEYAMPIDQIKEIVITPSMAKIPQTPEYIMGVANIRGTIIAMMDLEQKFDLYQSNPAESWKYTLVIESENHKVGILSRKVPSTLSVRESKIDRSNNIMQYSSLDQECIDGIVKSGDRLIILIDVLRMIEKEQLNIPILKV